MISLDKILSKIMEESGSDIYILPGTPVKAKVRGTLKCLEDEKCSVQDCTELIRKIYALAGNRSIDKLKSVGDDDFSFSLASWGAFGAARTVSGAPMARCCGRCPSALLMRTRRGFPRRGWIYSD